MRTGKASCLAAGLAIAVLLAGPVAAQPGNDTPPCEAREALAHALARNPDLRWPQIRAACDQRIAEARAADPVGRAWFANAANGFEGVPLVLLKVLPDLAPEIWGRPEDFFSGFGLFPDPDIPDRILPRGLGVAGDGRPLDDQGRPLGEIDYGAKGKPLFVTLACGACHSGEAEIDGRRIVYDGAPNTRFDVRKWRAAFSALRQDYLSEEQIGTPDKPGETTRRLVALVAAKPAGFFARGLPGIPEDRVAPVDAGQRAIFAAAAPQILSALAKGSEIRAAAVALQQRAGSSYGHPDSPGLAGESAGQSDGSGDLLADLLAAQAADRLDALQADPLPEALPRFATVTDVPAVWNQADRTTGQWDGSVLDRFWRNIAAQLPIVGKPGRLDLWNAALAGEYLTTLPSPPWPFDVDLPKAARGEAIFARNCGTCHRPRNDSRYPQIGTDANRARVLNAAASQVLLQGFRAACHDPDFHYQDRLGRRVAPCAMPDYRVLRDTVRPANQGYLAPPLDGIWLRAPYLHNGSVPTLAQLLQPATRPARFLRGAIAYDGAGMGWVWQPDQRERLAPRHPTLWVHDTGRDGLGNGGHDTDLMIDGRLHRLDWSDPAHAAEFEMLMEYLKTL